MNKSAMMQTIYKQLAVDYNCSPQDFQRDEIIITKAKEARGRRAYPFITPRLELITFGKGLIVNTSEDILETVKSRIQGKSVFEIVSMPFVYNMNLYYLPDLPRKELLLDEDGFDYDFLEKCEISKLYDLKGFDFALQYDVNDLHPEELAVTARKGGAVVGIASALYESAAIWSINVDVLPPFQGYGLATKMVTRLTDEVLRRGIIPYYNTGIYNIGSQRVALRAGYFPAWSHSYRARIDLL